MFLKIITTLAALAGIISLIYTFWKDSNKPPKNSNTMKNKNNIKGNVGNLHQGNINVDNSLKLSFGSTNQEFEVKELFRKPIKLGKLQFRNIWLLLVFIIILLFFFYLLIKAFQNISAANPLKNIALVFFTTAFATLYLFGIFKINKLFVFTNSLKIVNYCGKLYKTDYSVKCYCGGKGKIKQNLGRSLNSNYLQCKADKNHTAPFDPNRFYKDNYA